MATSCDVFLSYSHEDTGNSFTSHLNAALTRNGFHTSIPNQTHEAGNHISDTILTKISHSHVSVVVFSHNYGRSGMCLEELLNIIRCMKENGQKVLPVFLGGVEPTHVRNQTGPFGDAFNVLIQQEALLFKDKEVTWRRALEEAANLSGWDSKQKSESIIVDEVVNRIEKVFLHEIPWNDLDDGFVGVARIAEVESLLGVGTSERVRLIGLWGMGGIGKTTIAERVFCRVAHHFEGACFLGNVRERLERNGIDCLRRDIVSQLLGVEGPHILSPSIQRNLRRKRILLVLDDVNDQLHLKTLIGGCGYCGEGSRFMLIGRNKQVLKNNECKEIYKVKKLNKVEAFQLFKLHAFKQSEPTTLYLELSEQLICYAQGLPLALKVLGCNLYDKSIKEWESELAKLKQMPDMDIGNILRISFDGLADKEKSIFLDVACIFKGWPKDRVENILDASPFYAGIGISRLIDRALLTVSSSGILRMHDLLQQLGQDIVLHECEHPGKRSRLWEWKDIYEVLTQNKGSDKIEAITLDLSKVTNMHLVPTVFTEMSKLRVLNFYFCGYFYGDSSIKIHLPNGLESLPNELRYLCWFEYPLASLPRLQHLVELNMRRSRLKQLWSGQVEPHLPNLKYLDLTKCNELVSLPKLSKMPNLETLVLSCCSSLVEVPSSIQQLSKLQCLSLDSCSSITRLPELPPNIIDLDLHSTAIKWLPSSIGSLYQLQSLVLEDCKELLSLPSNIGRLQCLECLLLNRCSNLMNVPESLGDLVSLKVLNMGESAITRVFVSNLKSLESLLLYDCWNLKELPENLGNLESLRRLVTSGSPVRSLPSSTSRIRGLTYLECMGYKGSLLPLFLNSGPTLVNLVQLFLCGSDLEILPAAISNLTKLQSLILSNSRNLKFIPKLPSSLVALEAMNCTSLKDVQSLFRGDWLWSCSEFSCNFLNCFKLNKEITNRDAKLILQAMTSPLFSQGNEKIKRNHESNQCSFILAVPGHNVPEWFEYSGSGSSLAVKLSTTTRKQLDSRVLAFCVVAVPLSSCSKDFGIECSCTFVDAATGVPKPVSCEFDPAIYIRDDKNLPLESVFIWYDNWTFGDSNYFSEAVFKFKIRGWTILKCGITPLQQQDVVGGEEGGEPLHKKQKILVE